MDLPIFDISNLSSPEQRRLCESLILRGDEVVGSLGAAYLRNHQIPKVKFAFRKSPFFNASAQKRRDGYFIDVHIASVLLLEVLFNKLLSSPQILPELANSLESPPRFKVPFITDLSSGVVDSEFVVALNARRQAVAYILQDFCIWFVLLHEICHVVCGHCRGVRHFFDESKIQEFFSIETLLMRGRFLRTSWEYDADITASSIFCQYVWHFHDSKKNPPLDSAFRFVEGNLPKLVGLVTASLFAMFIYLAQMEYQINVKSYHPNPMLRIKYIGQALLRKATANYALDRDEVYKWQIEFMAQVAQEMDELKLFDWDKFDADFSETDGRISKLASISRRLRNSCKSWSWFPIDRWEEMGV